MLKNRFLYQIPENYRNIIKHTTLGLAGIALIPIVSSGVAAGIDLVNSPEIQTYIENIRHTIPFEQRKLIGYWLLCLTVPSALLGTGVLASLKRK